MTDYWGAAAAAAAVGRPTQTPSAPAPAPCETHGQYSCNKVDCNCNKSCRLFIRSRGGSFNPLKQDWLGRDTMRWDADDMNDGMDCGWMRQMTHSNSE